MIVCSRKKEKLIDGEKKKNKGKNQTKKTRMCSNGMFAVAEQLNVV